MSIPGISTRRPVAVWMLFLAIVLLGVISYVRLPIDLLPWHEPACDKLSTALASHRRS